MKSFKPAIEALEPRDVPALWGNPWPEPERLSLSFAPDGTPVADRTNTLFNHLDSTLPRDQWQLEALRAFQTWAEYANINLSLVEDGGLGFGTGPLIGAQDRGDIRLASAPLAATELAVATPYDLFGSWAGDVVLNNWYAFNSGGGANRYDLFTVLLQEAGHVFGLPNSPDATSAMYSQYQGVRAGPSTQDVANLQALYGARRHDRFDAQASNNTRATATPLRFIYDADEFRGTDPSQGNPPWVAHGDLTTRQDVDFYSFQVPTGTNDFSVELRTSGVNLLTARVTVYNASGQVVGTTAAADPRTGNLSLFIANAVPGNTYTVRVAKAQNTAFGVGAYHLAVGKEAHEALYSSTTTFLNDDKPDDDDGTDEPLIDLAPRAAGAGPAWEYGYRASVSYAGDFDRYRVVAPSVSGGSLTMIVTGGALEVEKLDPKVTVYESGPTPRLLPAQILRNDQGNFTVQVQGVTPGGAYEIRVEAADPQGSYKEGNYFVGVDFLTQPVTLDSFVAGTLTQGARQKAERLDLMETRLFHFTLTAATAHAAIESAVRMTIYNANQQVVFTLVARAGEVTSGDVLLAPGTYTIRFAAKTRDSSATLPDLAYALTGLARNDPIGPQPVLPNPVPPPTPPPPLYVWMPVVMPPWINLDDPYGDPWAGI